MPCGEFRICDHHGESDECRGIGGFGSDDLLQLHAGRSDAERTDGQCGEVAEGGGCGLHNADRYRSDEHDIIGNDDRGVDVDDVFQGGGSERGMPCGEFRICDHHGLRSGELWHVDQW